MSWSSRWRATFQPELRLHNDLIATDVDDDGFVSPTDVILIINELNDPQFTDSTGRVIGVPSGRTKYPDVDDDGFISPTDVILIVSDLNSTATVAMAVTTQATDAALGAPLDAEAEPGGELNPLLDDFADDIAVALAARENSQGTRSAQP